MKINWQTLLAGWHKNKNYILPFLYLGKYLLVLVSVVLLFFYSFWFTLSEEKLKNFILAQAKNSLQGDFSIGAIKKNWCSVDILELQAEKVKINSLKITFCSWQFFSLQKIPLLFSLEGGEIQTSFPILAKQSIVQISPDFDLNKIPIVSNYVGFRGKPTHSLNFVVNNDSGLEVVTNWNMQQVIIDKTKIQPVFIQGFFPEELVFNSVNFQGTTKEGRTNIQLRTQGFFRGNINGLFASSGQFLQSKVSLRIVGSFEDASKLNPLIKGFLDPYLQGNNLSIKLGGSLLALKPEKIEQ